MKKEDLIQNDSIDISTENSEMMLEKYHNLLIKREHEFALAMKKMSDLEQFSLKDPTLFLQGNLQKFHFSLLYEAFVRLVLVLLLWVLVLIQTGFTWVTILGLILTVVIYVGLELLAIDTYLTKVEETIN